MRQPSPFTFRDEALHLRWLIFLTLAGVLLSLFINVTADPLLMEEERRAMIAQEMDLQGNYIVPTQIGDHYFMKPPFFNWVLIGVWKVTGGAALFNTRLVSILSLLFMAIGQYYFTRRYLSAQVAFYASVFLILAAEIYFYYSMRAEIDLFYAFISYYSFIALYHFWERKNLLLMFLSVYALNGMGVLTKGPPSVIFIVASLGVFLLMKRELKKLFTWQHLVGIAAFLLIVGTWVLAYKQYGDPMGFVEALGKESVGRTGLKKSSILLQHLLLFPLQTLGGIMPAGILIFFAFRKGWFREVWRNDFLQFCLVFTVVQLLPYWLSPGTRSRYIFMIYPFPITLLVWSWFTRPEKWVRLTAALRGLVAVCLMLLVAVGIILPFLPRMFASGGLISSLSISLTGAPAPAPLGMEEIGLLWKGILVALLALVMLVLWWRYKKPVLLGMMFAVIIARIVFDLVALPLRGKSGDHVDGWNAGIELAKRTEGHTLWVYNFRGPGAFPFGGAFTYDRASQKVLRNTLQTNCTDYYVTLDIDLAGRQYLPFWEFTWKNQKYQLVKFTDCQPAQ